MASLSDSTIYNTELLNMVLEAMDNFKPILFCENNGSIQISPTWIKCMVNTSNNIFTIDIRYNNTYCTIYPSTTATTADLYIPQNITPSLPSSM